MATAANFNLEKDSAFLKAGLRAKITIKGIFVFAVLLLISCTVLAYSICINTLADRAEYTMLNGSMPKTMSLAAQVVEDHLNGDLTPQTAQAALNTVRMTENSALSVVDKTGKVIAGDAIDAPAATVAKLDTATAGNVNYKNGGEPYLMSFAPIEGTSWCLVMTAPRGDFGSVARAGVIYGICLALFAFGFAAFGLVAAMPKLTNPLKILVPAIERISGGDFSGEVPDAGPTYVDFIKLQDSVGVLMNKTNSVIADISFVLGEMAQGNFVVQSRSPESYVGDYQAILTAEELIRDQLANTLTEINDVSEQVSSGSEQVSNGAQSLAQGATEQASSVEELSATTADVATQIRDSAEFAEQASTLTKESGEIMSGTMQAMSEAKAAMDEISETSNNISKVIKAIDDIAFQTNILALNAAVEAARAGAAGKGFAVVADEVRNLSQKSAEAAKNTTALIESSIEAVGKGNKLVDKATSDFEVVVEKSSKINEIVNSISEQFRQQAVAANQISQGIEQVASVIQMNSATSEESAAASQELSGQANILKDLVSQFKLDVD